MFYRLMRDLGRPKWCLLWNSSLCICSGHVSCSCTQVQSCSARVEDICASDVCALRKASPHPPLLRFNSFEHSICFISYVWLESPAYLHILTCSQSVNFTLFSFFFSYRGNYCSSYQRVLLGARHYTDCSDCGSFHGCWRTWGNILRFILQ